MAIAAALTVLLVVCGIVLAAVGNVLRASLFLGGASECVGAKAASRGFGNVLYYAGTAVVLASPVIVATLSRSGESGGRCSIRVGRCLAETRMVADAQSHRCRGLLVLAVGWRAVVLATRRGTESPPRTLGGVLVLVAGGVALVLALVSRADGFEVFVPAMLMLYGASALVDRRRGRSAR